MRQKQFTRGLSVRVYLAVFLSWHLKPSPKDLEPWQSFTASIGNPGWESQVLPLRARYERTYYFKKRIHIFLNK